MDYYATLRGVDKYEHVEALCERLKEHMEVVEEILEEIRVELQWGVRNGRIRIVSMAADPCAKDMRINEADQPTYCPDCDTEVPSLAEAIRRGWADLRERDGGFHGTCPECVANSSDLADADARDAGTTISTRCDAEPALSSQAKCVGQTVVEMNEPASDGGQIPDCDEQTNKRPPGRLF